MLKIEGGKFRYRRTVVGRVAEPRPPWRTSLQQLVNGIAWGSIYALIALGYTMVYGVLQLINFAHGDVYMVGAMAGYYAAHALGFAGARRRSAALVRRAARARWSACGAARRADRARRLPAAAQRRPRSRR